MLFIDDTFWNSRSSSLLLHFWMAPRVCSCHRDTLSVVGNSLHPMESSGLPSTHGLSLKDQDNYGPNFTNQHLTAPKVRGKATRILSTSTFSKHTQHHVVIYLYRLLFPPIFLPYQQEQGAPDLQRKRCGGPNIFYIYF